MRVLVVSHTSLIGGAERSLLTFLQTAPDGVDVVVACPDGPLADALRGRGVPHRSLRGTDGSLRLHPVHTVRALGELASMSAGVRRHARATRADLVHANSARAGLAAVAARALGGPPVAVHVRDVLPAGHAGSLVRTVLRRSARTMIAISDHVAAAFTGRADAPGVHVVRELVDTARFRPLPAAAARAALDVPDTAAVLTVVAQLTPWKGQDTAIRALAHVRRTRPEAVLLIVGEATFVAPGGRFDNRAYERSLHELAEQLSVADAVRFLGAREDVPTILAASDLVLVPSHEEPFGLAVIEGMAMERGVLATRLGGPAEVITDGRDGRLLDPLDPAAWAGAVEELLADPAQRSAMGRAARRRVVEAFTPAHYAEAMLTAYRATLAD